MGIPKFYRYISERYPCLNEIFREHQIPEFDNLYLDMNGIIHYCSHPGDNEVSFRITEEEIFKNIFHYIELLFRIIQPQKLCFLAVDGVAPRAKINHQRSRRFKVAKDVMTQEAKAIANGIKLPPGKRFDSNAITPGTLFMYKLNKQLKYFITSKISTDSLWQKCKVIFTGSEVPGEGEHKIMNYIRYMKSQPDYDKHTKHCLYGLDADLIMLGLSTHEIHFTLLREKVMFGKKLLTPQETDFCLFHLSLLRDYINLEFASLKEKLSFPYDLEKIIDDWMLMGFLVGNDFIPNLPNLHIVHGALSILHHVYMDVLPTLDGYINEAGTLKLDRFEKFMEKLSRFDILQFCEHYADLKYLEGKMERPLVETEKFTNLKKSEGSEKTSFPKKVQDKEFDALIRSAAEMSTGSDDELDDEFDEETYELEFVQHKRDYYMNKLEYKDMNEDVLRSQAEGYVTAIQWNLNYYYNGCCSWSWYYPYHYAPYISDIKGFKDLKIEFELGEPFLPFEQLLATLPPYSKDLLPAAFQPLVTEENSPIIDYYPTDFETDLNGKTHEWESVVLIPFIQDDKLIEAMTPYYDKLTEEERARNVHGPMYSYVYAKENFGICKAPEYFPDVVSHARVQQIEREEIMVPEEKLIKGLLPGVDLDVYYPGFPTLQNIKYTSSLEKAKLRVFERMTAKESMILHIIPPPPIDLTKAASELLGKSIYVNWPHITEAEVIGVSDGVTKLSLINPQENYCEKNVNKEMLQESLRVQWYLKKKHIIENYMNRFGIEVGDVQILVHVRPLVGKKYLFNNHGKLTIEKQWSETQAAYAYQMIVKDIKVYNPNTMPYNTAEEVFVPGSVCFMLGHPYYGAMGEVRDPAMHKNSSRVNVSVTVMPEPSLKNIKRVQENLKTPYMSATIAAKRLGISAHLLSKITGTIYIKQLTDTLHEKNTSLNIGLNLKFNKKNEEVPGYTRKENGQWLYSSKVVNLIRSYMTKYPDLFNRLGFLVDNKIFLEDELFNKDEETLNDVVAWVKEQLQGFESRACGVKILDPTTVKSIEEEIEQFLATHTQFKIVEMQVKPYLLYKPGLQLRNILPDLKAQTYLLDRVCCTRESFTVPIGYKGTVIGIQKAENFLDTIYIVVFDKTFEGGLSVNGCSELRGYRLAPTDFINISHGQRIKYGKTGTGKASTESIDASIPASNEKAQSRANAIACASLRETNHSPAAPSTSSTSKNSCHDVRLKSEMHYKCKQYNNPNITNAQENCITMRSAHQNTPSPSIQHKGQSIIKPTSEFQALWNELHKKQQKPSKGSNAKPAAKDPKAKQIGKGFSQNSPQDPSAFLKAMLKISDENAQQKSQSTETTSNNVASQQEDKVEDTPRLVQQLFDHARQNEKVNEEKIAVWYCSQLLNYCQLNRAGVPKYSYFADGETNLIRAHVLLPDQRVFVSDPCMNHEQAAGSAAKKAYKELNLVNALPNMKLLLPPSQHWFPNQQNNTWSQNVQPSSTVSYYLPKPQAPPQFLQWTPKSPHSNDYQKGAMQTNQHVHQPQLKSNYNEAKTEPKDSTLFVPLQAQKKSRNVTNKRAGNKDTNQSVKNNSQLAARQNENENATKTTKVETTSSVTTGKQNQTQTSTQKSQSTQNIVKPKKSRVAAKFCIPPQTQENHSQNST